MNPYKDTIKICKLPLAIAISSVILVGCSNTSPVNNNTRVTNIPKTNVPSNNSVPVYTIPQNRLPSTDTVSSVPAIDNDVSSAILDDESLEELANLLEATDMTMVEDDQLAIEQYGNLWDRLRAGFSINQNNYQYNPRIEAQKNWFTSRQDYINRLTARASRYLYHTVSEAERRNIPTELALLPVIESSYDPTATSNANAAGLWQFIPSTGRIYGLTQTSSYDGRRDVIESTRAAYDFLTALYNQFGSWELALAAYNAGPGRVQRAIDTNLSQGLPTDFWSLNLPQETRNYVPRFLAVAQIVADSNRYNTYFPAIANRQHFRSVPVNYGVTLDEVSRYSGIAVDELRMLNPSLINARVDTSGPNRIIVPNSVNASTDSILRQLSGSNAYLPNVPDSQYEQLTKSSEGLAEFVTKARVPTQNSKYIAPNPSYNTPVVRQSNVKAIETQLENTNTLPTTSANITNNATITQEPPLSEAEKRFIADQIRSQTPNVGEVVSPVDGNVKLQAIQTQQSVLDSRGEEKRLSFASQNATQPKPSGKRTVYTVKRGDTLSTIAQRAGLNWRDIANWNQINANENLLAGSTLYLYNARPMSSTQNTVPNSSINQRKSYTVRSGDTLIGTANRFGLSVSQLARYNNLSTNAQLRTGQTLWLIPGMTTSSTTTASQPTNVSQYQGRTQTYRVQRGDTLIGLAARYNIEVSTLAAMNNLSTNQQLLTNQRLKVPANTISQPSTKSSTSNNYKGITSIYKVQSGDTLIGIANKLGVSRSQIAQLNNIASNAQLQRGRRLTVPASAQQVSLLLLNESVAYKVKSGDTLIGLANKFNIPLRDLAAMNGLSTNSQLRIGQTLSISKNGTQSNSQSSDNQSSRQTSSYGGSYTVRSGDTLIGLANGFGISVSDLASANSLSINTQLQISQKLKVPTRASANAHTQKPAVNTNRSGNSVNKSGSYTVKSGDSLIRLASNNGLTVRQLADANNLSTNAQLKIGQKITIPSTTTTYKVKSGDTLIGLAKRFGLTTTQLAKLNGISSNTMLQRGQSLVVPNK